MLVARLIFRPHPHFCEAAAHLEPHIDVEQQKLFTRIYIYMPTIEIPTVGYPTVGYPTVGYPTEGYPTVGFAFPARQHLI